METCHYCQEPGPTFQCGYACGSVIYCDQECADADFPRHSGAMECIQAHAKALSLIGAELDFQYYAQTAKRYKGHIKPRGDVFACKVDKYLTDWRCRVANGWVLRLFHQTNFESANAIVSSQKMLAGSSGGYVGNGIYFALTPEETDRKATKKGSIIQADVFIGRMAYVMGPRRAIEGKMVFLMGFDSVWIDVNLHSGPEIIVYWSEQVANMSMWFKGQPVPSRPLYAFPSDPISIS